MSIVGRKELLKLQPWLQQYISKFFCRKGATFWRMISSFPYQHHNKKSNRLITNKYSCCGPTEPAPRNRLAIYGLAGSWGYDTLHFAYGSTVTPEASQTDHLDKAVLGGPGWRGCGCIQRLWLSLSCGIIVCCKSWRQRFLAPFKSASFFGQQIFMTKCNA